MTIFRKEGFILPYINEKLCKYRKYLKGKRAAVIGVGISNIPLIGFLLECGANVTARDAKDFEALSKNLSLDVYALCKKGVKFVTGNDYLSELCEDIIFKSPGIRYDVPEILQAVKNGAVLTSEMEAFLSLCPSKIIAITGSDGKTTTTTLTAKILEAAGHKVFLGGNIGKPLLSEIDEITPDDFTVLELSSFQLHTVNRFENKELSFSHITFPDCAIVTNVSPNHLNWHTDMQEYVDAKKAVFANMKKGGRFVTNALCDITAKFALEAEESGFCTYSFRSDGKDADVCLKDGAIYFEGEKIIDSSDILLPGKHNRENYMAAIAAVYPYVTKDAIKEVATTFGGVEHRLELVRVKDNVKYYNSSIDSSPARTKAALSCFDESMNGKIVLILGGKDKNLDFTELGDIICQKVKHVFISHDTPDNKMYNCVLQSKLYGKYKTPVTVCSGFDEAAKLACECAKENDAVVLSPAATSFDEFSNFEERGRRFKDIVNSL